MKHYLYLFLVASILSGQSVRASDFTEVKANQFEGIVKTFISGHRQGHYEGKTSEGDKCSVWLSVWHDFDGHWKEWKSIYKSYEAMVEYMTKYWTAAEIKLSTQPEDSLSKNFYFLSSRKEMDSRYFIGPKSRHLEI